MFYSVFLLHRHFPLWLHEAAPVYSIYWQSQQLKFCMKGTASACDFLIGLQLLAVYT